MRSDNLYALPAYLPVPVDDGACSHLAGLRVPSISLPATDGTFIDLSAATAHSTVVYCYPRTGSPDAEPSGGVQAWNRIPGARGCTPQALAFRDQWQHFRQLGVQVYGLSTQDVEYQREAVVRLHLPFSLLSDAELNLTRALGLPTFTYAEWTLLIRVTLVIRAGMIVKVFYPVFPPDQNAVTVLSWFRTE